MPLREAFTPFVALTGVFLSAALAWCLWPAKPEAVAAPIAPRQSVRPFGEPIQPIFAVTGIDPARVSLGKRLFHDPRLSRDDTVSCASCHGLHTAGVDQRPRSLGVGRREGERNAPTVFNACFNYRQFWDGRVASLEEQVDGPLRAHSEMDSDWGDVIRKLRQDSSYTTAFETLYPDGIQPANVKDAIASFERSLVTPGAPFDDFLKGQRSAISERARNGYRLFQSYGCISCHQGAGVGGNMMEPFGVLIDPTVIRRQASRKDRRLIQWSDIEASAAPSKVRYKVPSLRNIARTGPYFHNGTVGSLSEAVRIMALSQLGRRLSEEEVAAIVAFLETLTGKYEGKTL